jgi:hypothetical protein
VKKDRPSLFESCPICLNPIQSATQEEGCCGSGKSQAPVRR